VPRHCILALLILGSFALGGCNTEKARVLQGAAVQFRNESLNAIDAIDTMRKRELEAPPRSAADVRQSFISRVLNSKSDISSTLIDLAIDPNRVPRVTEWEDFVTELKGQYEGFAGIFDRLEGGTLVGIDEVRKSGQYAKKLTVQMALLSDAISKNPPVLTQYRSRVITRLKKVRQDYQTVQGKVQAKEQGGGGVETLSQLIQRRSELENQTGDLLGDWQQIKQEEQKLLETTVAQCTKAVVIGKALIETADHYDDLSLSQLNLTLPRIFSVASGLTGRDFSSVKFKSAGILSQLQTDPFWSQVTRELLDRANTAAQRRTDLSIPLDLSRP
jgi:hypothetical protein